MRNTLFYIFLLIYCVGFSQSDKVQVEIDTTNIRIGEQFQYKISVNETENVIIPSLTNLKGLEIVDSLKIENIKNKLVKKYILTGFDSGAFYIPQQQIFIKNQAYLTDSLLVNVATIAIDTTKAQKFPIKGIKTEGYQYNDFEQYFWWVVALLILIGALLYYFIIRKKKEIKEEVIVPLLPPYEEAIEKLQALDKKLLWQNNEIKKYYSELTNIVRGYIERELKLPALEITTDELMDVLNDFNNIKSIETDKETIYKLKKLLQESDLVKFAKSKPMDYEIEQDRKDAKSIIDNLKPKKEAIEDEVE
ncbi:BatD family protein [Tenacibaculum pacificus]|uniref:BatD family protein n=1 Tax=Tenacibaculum pacificus TaxID=3018314 RepID=UPI0022F3CB46|nr:BatD family protein [Tenacibaculum pacificus]WBX73501.1 BatD family protein [Tenacibaculum pacificus]